MKICPLPYMLSDGRLLTRTSSSFKRLASIPPNDAIDREVFDQLLELDEDEELFSKDMVDAYSIQADKTFSDMDLALCAFVATLLLPLDMLIGV